MRPWFAVVGLLLLVQPSAAQRAPTRDMNWLALQWGRGEFSSPLVCEIDGTAHRGLRRLLITSGPRHLDPPVNRLRFFDLEVPAGTHCVTEMGDAPNVVGSLAVLHRGPSRVDTADHDFASALRREGGFEYEIVRGILKLGPSADPDALREVDFSGGRALLTTIKRGSDAYRRLADLSGRKLQLALEASDGTRIQFDLVQREPR